MTSNEMICQSVTLSGYAEWPKVADAVIEACKPLPTDGGFMVSGDTHSSLVVALLHALFPHAVVLTKRQGRAPLTVDIGPSVHRIFKNILASIIRGELPPQ